MADQGEGFSVPNLSVGFQSIERLQFVPDMFNPDSYNSGYVTGFAAGSIIAPFPVDSSVVAITATNASGPITGLTPVFIGYYNAETGSSQTAPTITEIGQGNYKFTPTGSYPAGLIDLGATAVPRYLVFSTVSRYKVFAAFDIDRAPLAALSPLWLSLKKIGDNTDYSQPVIEQLGSGLYRTGWTADHTVGIIDLGSTAYPRYYQYDSEITAEFISGYANGELYGFSSPKDEVMHVIKPGETDVLKKTITFMVYDSTGLPASGNVGEAAVVSPASGELQVNKNLAGYVNAAGTFAHIADGKYRYVFDDTEVSGSTEGYALLRLKVSGYRTNTQEVILRFNNINTLDAAAVTAVQSGLATSSALSSVASSVTSVDTKIGTPAAASVSADIASVKSTVDGTQTTVTELHKIEVGRWKIQNNQLLLFDTNGTTVIRTFDLLDDEGNPSMTKIFERNPVP